MFDGKAYGEGIVEIVKGYVEREIAPLKAENADLKDRLKALEDRPLPEVDLEPVEKLIEARIAKIPAPEPAKEVDREMVYGLVDEAVSALPPPKDGEPGRSVEISDVLPMIAEQVAKAVAALPAPKDGENGKDAAGIVEALKDDGELVLTLQDGRLIRTGVRDGRDGEPGKDGRDGFSLEDFDIQRGDDQRTLILRFEGKEVGFEYELTLQHPIYCGVFKEGQEYMPGDMVTWGGSLWHCNEETKEKPDAGPWTLAVKKGRDGKDGKNG